MSQPLRWKSQVQSELILRGPESVQKYRACKPPWKRQAGKPKALPNSLDTQSASKYI
jgi:hypothetical protein